jgi:serine/threonine protein kinase/nitrous oxidase accessory protein NosD
MSRNEEIARWLKSRSVVSTEVLQQALQLVEQQGGDLCELLIEQGNLKPEWREAIARAASKALQKPGPVRKKTEALPESAGPKFYSGSTASNCDSNVAFLNYDGLKRYAISGEIGRGGMGRVYLAVVKSTGAEVVIKTLLKVKKCEKQVERLRREAVALAQLSHPNIVKVHDVKISGIKTAEELLFPYVVMEHVQGDTFDRLIEDSWDQSGGPPDIDQLRRIFAKLAAALIHCHERGILHRDVKPSNILIEKLDDDVDKVRPVLIDFGLVKLDPGKLRESLEVSQHLTKPGQTLGTPAFAAPEQICGKLDEISEATDVWGLAATLYYSLCDQVPYQLSHPYELYAAVRRRDPKRVRKVDSRVPPWLDDLCASCLQRDASRRPTMKAVLQALESRKASRAPLPWKSLAIVFLTGIALLMLIQPLLSIDTRAPILTLEKAVVTRERSVEIRGTIDDDSPCRLFIKRQGGSASYIQFPVAEDGHFQVRQKIEREGLNRFFIKCEDSSGNVSKTLSWNVNLDTKAPAFVLAKLRGSTYDSTIIIAGRFEEDCSVYVGKQRFQTGNRSFEQSFPLKAGWNRFRVSCRDSAGNESFKTVNVERLPVIHVAKSSTAQASHSYDSVARALISAAPRSRIFVHPGIYNESFVIKKEVEIIGVGEASKVILRSSTRASRIRAKTLLKKLTFECLGVGKNSQALRVLADDCVIENCTFYSLNRQGLAIGSGDLAKKSIAAKRLILKNCQLQKSAHAGLTVAFGSDATAVDCLFRKNGHSGVFVTQQSKVDIYNCRFEDNRSGVAILQKAEVRIESSHFTDNQGEAVWVDDRSNVVIKNCQILRNGRWDQAEPRPSLNVMSDSRMLVVNCRIAKGFGVGVLSQDRGILRLKNCKIFNNQSAGLAAQREGIVYYEQCKIQGNRAGPFYKRDRGKIRRVN